MKNVFIIPGFGHKSSGKAYKNIAGILKEEGYSPIPVSISWRKNTIRQSAEYFLKKYKLFLTKKSKRQKNYILGFSYGAIIAFIAATKIQVDGLILCSLSPFFKEDLPKKISKKRLKEFFLETNCYDLISQIKTKQVHMLYGINEAKPLIKRVNETFNHIQSPRKYLTAISKTEHNIGDKRYLYQIYKTAQILR